MLLDATLRTLILHLSFLKCFALINMINSFWIAMIIIFITKINIKKGSTIEAYIIDKDVTKPEPRSI